MKRKNIVSFFLIMISATSIYGMEEGADITKPYGCIPRKKPDDSQFPSGSASGRSDYDKLSDIPQQPTVARPYYGRIPGNRHYMPDDAASASGREFRRSASGQLCVSDGFAYEDDFSFHPELPLRNGKRERLRARLLQLLQGKKGQSPGIWGKLNMGPVIKQFKGALVKESHRIAQGLQKGHCFLDMPDNEGVYPLEYALRILRSQAVVRRLLELGAPINQPFRDGNHPLHLAVSLRLPDVVEVLLGAGANSTQLGQHGLTPFALAQALADNRLASRCDRKASHIILKKLRAASTVPATEGQKKDDTRAKEKLERAAKTTPKAPRSVRSSRGGAAAATFAAATLRRGRSGWKTIR